MSFVEIITWALTSIGSILTGVKSFIEVKKLIDTKVMPDIQAEDKAEEIVRKQELARNLVAFTGIEAAYYTARGLIIALNFIVIMHYAYKFSAQTQKGNHHEPTP